jgi:hypothetical protein
MATHLHGINPLFGNNGKRGNAADISDDAVNYSGEGADFDPQTTPPAPCTVIDFIGKAGTPEAFPAWIIVTDPANPVAAAWVQPAAEMPPVGPGPTPNPPAPTYPTYEALGGDEGGKKITRQLEADYKRAGKPGLDGDCGAWQQRVSYDFLTGKVTPVEASIAKHRPDWCKVLGIPVT